MDSDRLFYHEMLHGQITVDEMKKAGWAGWDPLCKCTPLKDWRNIDTLLGAGDPDHKTIPGLESTYLDRLATRKGYKLAVDHRATGADQKREFRQEIAIPKEVLEKETPGIDWFGWNVDNVQITQKDNKLIITGRLSSGADRGKVWVYFDPPKTGMIVHVDVHSTTPTILMPLTATVTDALTGEPLSGVTLTVHKADGTLVRTLRPDATGKVTVSLPPDMYYVKARIGILWFDINVYASPTFNLDKPYVLNILVSIFIPVRYVPVAIYGLISLIGLLILYRIIRLIV